jgi:N-dimethylarginine dimethylaminohydrolase
MNTNNPKGPEIDAMPLDVWFPEETTFEADMNLYWGDWGVASEVDTLRSVLLRRPGKEIEDFDPKAVRFTDVPLDLDLFRRQHDNLAKVYRDHGVTVHYVEEQRTDRPNAVYCRDLAFMTPEGAILGRPGMAARRGEERYVAATLARLGVPIILTVHGDGMFEGANALWVDRRCVILSTSSRTNRSGYEQVAQALGRMGVDQIIPMQIPSTNIHIDALLGLASHDVAVVHAQQVPYDVCDALKRKGFKVLSVPSSSEVFQTNCINFVALEPGVVVQPEGAPRCRELLEKNGIKVIPVDVSEIFKGRGAIHCVTAFLKRG